MAFSVCFIFKDPCKNCVNSNEFMLKIDKNFILAPFEYGDSKKFVKISIVKWCQGCNAKSGQRCNAKSQYIFTFYFHIFMFTFGKALTKANLKFSCTFYDVNIFYIWKYISEYFSDVTSQYIFNFTFSLFFLSFWNFQISRRFSFVNLHRGIIHQSYVVRQLHIWIFIAGCWGSGAIIAAHFVYGGVWLINLVIWP